MKTLNSYITKVGLISTKEILRLKGLFFLLFIPTTFLTQGPVDGYNKGKNKLDIGFGYTFDKGSTYYAGTNLIGLPRQIESFSLFAIYGITNRLDVQANIPYININKGKEKNLQDGSIYLKYRFLKFNSTLGETNLLLATGFYQPLTDYQVDGEHAIGQANNALDGRIIIQHNFKHGFFSSIQGGYFLKTNPTPNSYAASLKIGYASAKWYADVWLENQNSFGGTNYRGIGEDAPTLEKGGFRGLGFGYNKVGATLYKPIVSYLGAYLGYAYTLNGRNISKSNRISFGVVFKPFK